MHFQVLIKKSSFQFLNGAIGVSYTNVLKITHKYFNSLMVRLESNSASTATTKATFQFLNGAIGVIYWSDNSNLGRLISIP